MSVSLAATQIAGASASTCDVVMLHGIYGRGRNWQGIARALVAARPEYTCWLVDMPHHGDSSAGQHGATVAGLAADVIDWMSATAIRPAAVLGHSYGGKVALAIAERERERPLQVWVIDSTPEVRDPSGSAWDMLRVTAALPPRFASRDEAIAGLVRAGYTLGVAQWMATNLVRDGNSFVWRLDFAVMESLLRDFFVTDLWSVIEQASPEHDIHFLKASESSAMSTSSVQRLERSAGPYLHLHHRRGSHWIHAEAPEIVTALLVEHLPR